MRTSQGLEAIRLRGDGLQAERLERWLERITVEYSESILALDAQIAQIWGRLRAPHPENPLDKQIAATALIYGLTVAARNTAHYSATGVQLFESIHLNVERRTYALPFLGTDLVKR